MITEKPATSSCYIFTCDICKIETEGAQQYLTPDNWIVIYYKGNSHFCSIKCFYDCVRNMAIKEGLIK